MALDFVGIRTEVFERGFQYLNDGGTGLVRVKRWVNEAVHEVDRKEPWPYLLTTLTGTMPATIANLGRLQSVVDVARDVELVRLPRAELLTFSGDLTETGVAEFAYRTPTGVAVWPVSTASFLTSYFKVAPDLVADADLPLMPDEYRMIICELAARAAYRDSGAFEAAADCMAAAEILLGEMRENLLDYPAFVGRTLAAADD